MKLVKANLKEVASMFTSKRKYGAATLAVKEFLNSDLSCAECFFDKEEYETNKKAYSSLYATIYSHDYPCFARYKGDRLFLFKLGVKA